MLLSLDPAISWSFPQRAICNKPLLTNTRSQKSSPILTIPPELIHQIFLHLNAQTLISMRQVCRAFYEVTFSRQFCYARIQQLCSHPGITHGGMRLKDSSIQALIQWMIHRLRVREQWASSIPPRFRYRLIDSRNHYSQTEVLPGGRWLFGLNFEGNMTVLDLTRKGAHPRILLRTATGGRRPLTKFRVWYEDLEKELSFRVALYNKDCIPRTKSPIQVVRVRVVGFGSDASFTTIPITVIPETEHEGRRCALSFNDNYVLQYYLAYSNAITGLGLSTFISLWRYTEPRTFCELHFSLGPDPSPRVRLLPPVMLALISCSRARLVCCLKTGLLLLLVTSSAFTQSRGRTVALSN
ncbi:hypothetical protein AN958_10613 [Leucoagaricus sp. SymC.cos]|nr:hypothetical protein AN958_10613 [Leucoagaricus sp. SymC.cos]